MSTEQLYTLLPLKWVKRFESWYQEFQAETPFGTYYVTRYREGWVDEGRWQSWTWKLSLMDERGIDEVHDCKSSAAGKAAAQEHWVKSMQCVLKPVVPLPGLPIPKGDKLFDLLLERSRRIKEQGK